MAPRAWSARREGRAPRRALKASEAVRLRRLARDAIYKADFSQLIAPIPRGANPAEYLVGLLRDLIPPTPDPVTSAR